jgi:protein-S-isoprenylcysteine O-methyltransferase Ste14
MSLVPAFQIGVWNAWIFTVCSLIPLILVFRPLVSRGQKEGTAFTASFSKMQKNAFSSHQLIYFILFIYSIFVPLKLGTVWFYVGLPIFLVGLIPYAMLAVNFVTTPLDQPVTRGIYRYSRHPMYVTGFLMLLGAGIASASWILLLLFVVDIILSPLFVEAEERYCLDKYGDAYREYMDRTPRWLGLPKSGKEAN